MNFKKTVAIATAVGALAALSVPAMAMENEFHGMYRLRGMMSNYENSAGGVSPTLAAFEQRARLQYIAKASNDLKLVTHFEIDSSWGEVAYGNGRGTGGAIGADTVNLETKNVYLDFNCPLTGANVKVGIQPLTDAFKGIFVNADMAGIVASKKVGGVTATAGFSRLFDYAAAGATGKNTQDLFLLDAKLAVSKDLTLGGAYYLLRDNTVAALKSSDSLDVHMVGVNAAAKFGIITADAFVAYQGGSELAATGRDLSAFAGQVAVKANLDKAGNVSGRVLFTSGGKATDSKAKAWQSVGNHSGSSENSYYEANMLLLMRSAYAMDSDKAIISTSNNGNHGVTLLAAGYDNKLTDKVGVSANIGYAMYSQKDAAANASIGTELNAQVDYKLFSNLTASLQAAYVVLGDGASKTADDPYLAGVMFNYTF